jgi:hypothetical protein
VSVKKLLTKLAQSNTFKQFIQDHPKAYLSHFFSSISSNFELKSNWEIGYYNQETKKISIFIPSESSFILKQEDDVFKKETTEVEKLNLDTIDTKFDDVSQDCKSKIKILFPSEIIGDGFIVLQTFNQQTQWNFTFVTKTLKFANVKINANSGKVDSHQLIEAVKQDK